MALHPVKLPKSAAHLFRIVAYQKRLLKALAEPALSASGVDTAWVQGVWRELDPEWVRRFCLGGQLGRIRLIAGAAPAARRGLYDEFCRQNKVSAVLNAGGDFRDLNEIKDFTTPLRDVAEEFFKQCYELLSHNVKRKWNGYEFSASRVITNQTYKDDFCSGYPTKVVCPYCDGEIGTPQLDHYLCKSGFSLLACSPWNLVPVCRSCNDVAAKGSRFAITHGPPRSTAEWLHPFFHPASPNVTIQLSGAPGKSIPQLHSPDADERTRLVNHTTLVRSMETRWTNYAAAYYDILVHEVNRRVSTAGQVDDFVRMRLEDHVESRGRAASSMVHAAVCQAVLDRRSEYLAEFKMPNAPALEGDDLVRNSHEDTPATKT